MERPGVVFSIFLVALIGTIQTTMAFDDGLAEISFSVLVFVSSFIIGETPGNSSGNLGKTSPYSPYIAPEPVPGILMVGGKEIGGGPVETFPAETCAGKIPDLDTESGGWYFFTLSLIPRDTRGWEGDAMLVACGGNSVGNKPGCVSWQQGQTEWRHYATLHHARSMGQAAALDDGSILLLGGQVDPSCGHNDPDCTGWTKEQTVERVTPDGNSEVVFSLKHGDNKGGCAVRLPNRGNTIVVLLGGGGAYWAMGEHHAHVEYYDKTGHLGSFPDMLQPRFEHACGYYKDERASTVLMVAGGAVDQLTKDSASDSVELLLPGARSWVAASPLPKAQGGVRAAVDGNRLLLTGIGNSILWYNPDKEQWEEVGTTKRRYWMHATVAGDLASLCQPSAKMSHSYPMMMYGPPSQAPAPEPAPVG